jgi:hypothetical protein
LSQEVIKNVRSIVAVRLCKNNLYPAIACEAGNTTQKRESYEAMSLLRPIIVAAL